VAVGVNLKNRLSMRPASLVFCKSFRSKYLCGLCDLRGEISGLNEEVIRCVNYFFIWGRVP
ncbi:MAG: hypothetical protein ABFD92_15640, partial [Planctomycetaceae bacterium]